MNQRVGPFSALIEGALSSNGFVELDDAGLHVSKSGAFSIGKGRPWFDVPLDRISRVSMEPPHLVVLNPKGKSFRITINGEAQLDALLGQLKRQAERPTAAPETGVVDSAPTSIPSVPPAQAVSPPPGQVGDGVSATLGAYSPEAARQVRLKRAKFNIVVGLLLAVIGVVVTWWSYSSAESHGGGTYIIAWGAMLFGPLQFLAGVLAFIKHRRAEASEARDK